MISEQIRQFLQSNAVFRDLVPTPLGDDYPLLDSGILDSVGIFEMIVFLEDQVGIKVRTEDIVEFNFRDIAAIARFAQNRLGAAQASKA
jgi:acyl carrier protein